MLSYIEICPDSNGGCFRDNTICIIPLRRSLDTDLRYCFSPFMRFQAHCATDKAIDAVDAYSGIIFAYLSESFSDIIFFFMCIFRAVILAPEDLAGNSFLNSSSENETWRFFSTVEGFLVMLAQIHIVIHPHSCLLISQGFWVIWRI